MYVHYLSCFTPQDDAETPLLRALGTWKSKSGSAPLQSVATDPEDLASQLDALALSSLDVLLIGGHGHDSRSGFWVNEMPLRWHDLAFRLRGKLPKSCSFIFYSCNGGYPGIAHVFGRESGPDFVFGRSISVYADAMTYAVMHILAWKDAGHCDAIQARVLVDSINAWATKQYPLENDHHQFLRVTWCEGSRSRYPDQPGGEAPSENRIRLRGWGL
mgnify:CR=1 FL=1